MTAGCLVVCLTGILVAVHFFVVPLRAQTGNDSPNRPSSQTEQFENAAETATASLMPFPLRRKRIIERASPLGFCLCLFSCSVLGRKWVQSRIHFAECIRAGRIQTLIVFGEDVTRKGIPAELLAKLDLLIVSDILPNETTRLAHFLLPGCAHAEKRGTFTNTKGRVQRFMKAVEPPRGARPEWEFLHELVFNATGQDGFVSIEGLFNQMAGEVPAFNGLTWGALKDAGVTVPV